MSDLEGAKLIGGTQCLVNLRNEHTRYMNASIMSILSEI